MLPERTSSKRDSSIVGVNRTLNVLALGSSKLSSKTEISGLCLSRQIAISGLCLRFQNFVSNFKTLSLATRFTDSDGKWRPQEESNPYV